MTVAPRMPAGDPLEELTANPAEGGARADPHFRFDPRLVNFGGLLVDAEDDTPSRRHRAVFDWLDPPGLRW